MSILSLAVVLESEWKHYSSSQSDENTLAFEYEFSFKSIMTKTIQKIVHMLGTKCKPTSKNFIKTQ